MRRVFAVLLALCALSLPGSVGTLAQDASPVAGADRFPMTPDPAACAGDPRLAEDLLALWFDPDGTPVPATTPTDAIAVTIELGTPADEATTAAVTESVVQVFSCFAAGDTLRAFAWFTDDLARAFGPEPGTAREDAAAFLAEGEADEGDDGEQLLAVTDASVLDDGRVGAFVVEEIAGASLTSYVLFERVDGRWLVDEVIEFGPAPDEDEGDGGGEATPAP